MKVLVLLVVCLLAIPAVSTTRLEVECLFILNVALEVFAQDYENISIEEAERVQRQLMLHREHIERKLVDAVLNCRSPVTARKILRLATLLPLLDAMTQFVATQTPELAGTIIILLGQVEARLGQ